MTILEEQNKIIDKLHRLLQNKVTNKVNISISREFTIDGNDRISIRFEYLNGVRTTFVISRYYIWEIYTSCKEEGYEKTLTLLTNHILSEVHDMWSREFFKDI